MSIARTAATALRANAYDLYHAALQVESRKRIAGRTTTLVTFAAAQEFREVQRRLNAAACASGEFDTIERWSPERFRGEPVYAVHRAIFDRHAGAGNWAWKPYIIGQAMAQRRDGDFIVYTDSGPKSVGESPFLPLAPLLAWLADGPKRLAAATLRGFPNRTWTKRDCFVLMDCDEERYWNVDQIQASYVALMICDDTRRLVGEWQRYALDPRVITDDDNRMGLPNFDEFCQHRFDQSILTNLVYALEFEVPRMSQCSKQIRACISEVTHRSVATESPPRNIALGKLWTISSPSIWGPSKGICGPTSDVHGKFFFHTTPAEYSYFKLDLGAPERVTEIRIYNRRDLCAWRAQRLRVWISSDDDDYTVIFEAAVSEWDLESPLFLRLDGESFRYIKIDLDEREALHLDGLEVYAE